MKDALSTDDFTEQEVRGILTNPVHAGFGPYSQLITDEQWIRAGARLIRDEGAEQYLVNLLHLLRQTFRDEP